MRINAVQSFADGWAQLGMLRVQTAGPSLAVLDVAG
jgi:hypothetical protein